MKKILLPFVVLLIIASCEQRHINVWTREYEQQMYHTVYNSIGGIMKDSAQRKEISWYLIRHAKNVLPYGLNSVSSDSLKNLFANITAEYIDSVKMINFHSKLPWNDEFKDGLRESLYNGRFKNSDNKDVLCDCFITKLKYIYPDSVVTPIPDTVMDGIEKECNAENSRP